MIIKRYLVNNMNEAMTRIRYELGNDAVIVSQRKIRKPGFSGFFSKRIFEVTAAIDNSKKAEPANIKNSIEAIKKIMENEKTQEEEVSLQTPKIEPIPVKKEVKEQVIIKEVAAAKPENKLEEKLLSEFQEMKSLLSDMAKPQAKTTTRKTKLQTELENLDLNDKNVKRLLTSVKNSKDAGDDNQKLKNSIKRHISISDRKMDGVVVLVGPTGVGKTTTIAKLAGRLALEEGKKVGLITVDTYRIGAVEQLKTYAEIMNIPFRVVITAKEMEKAIKEMSDCDTILVDTTGRSSKNNMQLSELRTFIEKTNSDNINLVVSCTTKDKDLQSIIEGFKVLNYNNVIITKLDETTTYGSILNILDCSNNPLNFVTTGQNVPDDIKKLSKDELCKLILGEDAIC